MRKPKIKIVFIVKINHPSTQWLGGWRIPDEEQAYAKAERLRDQYPAATVAIDRETTTTERLEDR
jgi:hypothetical protein